MQTDRPLAGFLRPYFVLTYLAVLVNTSAYLREVKYVGAITPWFAIATYLVYSFVYLMPCFLMLWLVDWILRWRFGEVSAPPVAGDERPSWRTASFIFAILATTALQVLLYADQFIFRLYGFHVNGFVLNLVFTPGGIASLGAGTSTTLSFALIIVGFLILQAMLLLIVLAGKRVRQAMHNLTRRRGLVWGLVPLILLGLFSQVTFGVSRIKGYTPVLVASTAFPLYAPISFNRLAKSFGVSVKRDPTINVSTSDSLRLNYPLQPIRWEKPAKPLNIVWLVSESLRADMLDQKIMPYTWGLAQKSLWCRHHYSAGNGTRMGMFGMFYGLYGPYWFSFLAEHRGPVVMDVLLEQGYQIDCYTSAAFTYPEFDKTIFARIPGKQLHELDCMPTWERDRQQTARLLNFIDQRDASRPFMTFMFFESPHANYHFPPECVIAKPYLEDFNYATMDRERDMPLIKNRYINACNHLDTQVQRIVEHVRAQGLMDSTIVLVTGDHGEEFMEHGFWGHNSTFVEQQTVSPFMLWVPGRAPREITHMTSHLDVPATIMPLLGVTNPPSDYSLGYDMYSGEPRRFTVISDWDRVVYVDQRHKAVLPLSSYGFTQQKITTADDAEVPDPGAFLAENKDRIVDVMKSLRTFSR